MSATLRDAVGVLSDAYAHTLREDALEQLARERNTQTVDDFRPGQRVDVYQNPDDWTVEKAGVDRVVVTRPYRGLRAGSPVRLVLGVPELWRLTRR